MPNYNFKFMFRVLCIVSKNLTNLTWQRIICAVLPWSGQESVSAPNWSKWNWGHSKHVVNTNVSIYIFVDTNVMLLLTACGCLRAVLNVKKILLVYFLWCTKLIYIYIYISFGNFVLGTCCSRFVVGICDVGKLYVMLGCNRKLW